MRIVFFALLAVALNQHLLAQFPNVPMQPDPSLSVSVFAVVRNSGKVFVAYHPGLCAKLGEHACHFFLRRNLQRYDRTIP